MKKALVVGDLWLSPSGVIQVWDGTGWRAFEKGEIVSRAELDVLVAVALGTVRRRRLRKQTLMAVDSERMPLEVVEQIARKYQR